jgi:4-amino-4-deoxy-L-arabinose transferase-like glycosyltransferase
MKQLLYILFGWGLTVIVSWCSGKLLLRRLPVRLSRQEEGIFAFLAGSACLSLAVFLMAALHLVYRGVFLGLSVLVIAAAWRIRVWRPPADSLPPVPRPWKMLFIGAWLLFGSIYFIHALAPEVSPDGMAYHLDFVARYAREHGFPAITNNFYASLPEGLEMLFLFAFVWGRHSAAALVHCTYLLLLPWLILNYERRIGMPVVGVAGGLLIYLSPVAGITGSSAYNDVALAAVAFAVFALLEIWRERRETAFLVPAGLLAGFAFAIKYTGFVAVPYAAAFTAYTLWRSRKPILRPVLTLCLCAVGLILPTLVKNWIVVRNPVSPFLNRLLPNPYMHIVLEQQWSRSLRSYEIHSLWELVRRITMDGQGMSGILGPIFLLAPLSLLALRYAPGRRLLLAAAVFLLPYPLNLGTRFLLPAATFIAPGIAMGLGGAFLAVPAAIGRRSPAANWRVGKIPVRISLGSAAVITLLLAAHAFLSWPLLMDWYAPDAWHLRQMPLQAALRLESEDSYLFSYMGADFQMMRFIERATPPGSRIFCFTARPAAYCARELLPWYYSAFNERLREVLWAGFDAGSQPLRILTFRFATQSLRGLRLFETGSDASATPSVNKLRFFGPSGELQPDPIWHFDAYPFPWEARLAFDRSPVTRWDAWQEIRERARLEVHFEKAESVSTVRVETKLDQAAVRWGLQGMFAGGKWVVLHTTLEEISTPPADLRRAAIQEFKRSNVRYILVDVPPFTDEFREHQNLWGVRKLAEFGNGQLYTLE